MKTLIKTRQPKDVVSAQFQAKSLKVSKNSLTKSV